MSAAYCRATHIPPGGHGSTPRPRRPPGFKAANLTSADRKVWLGRRRSVRYTAVAGSWQFDHKLVDQFAGAVDRLQTGLRSAVKLAAKLAALLTAAARSN
ncbi:hypothetical protein PGT21_028503 [Puccinia graminis f. sp. tritici]|uniref:Uncharacterized protein n=1 Tax=Puccinia graminis f. sp. tritici TaxID=56615 RepID=A0A5B0RTD3_PUCGR|nr:hypothetical protein PGT21_028503 [Puccinia graminis f. sp. tritici]KAA1128133.1 hypothetical protein PGTUg99_014189 [Puccinia graminis f. sp. tritici]